MRIRNIYIGVSVIHFILLNIAAKRKATMSANVPPQHSNSAYHQRADAEATRRVQEYQKEQQRRMEEQRQKLEEQRRAEERKRQLDAESRRRASQTKQGR